MNLKDLEWRTTWTNILRTVLGFKPFEVAISLLIVYFGAVSVLMLFPMRRKYIQMQGRKLIAANSLKYSRVFAVLMDEKRDAIS